MDSFNNRLDTQRNNFQIEYNEDLTQKYFSERNKKLIEDKVFELLENTDFLNKTYNFIRVKKTESQKKKCDIPNIDANVTNFQPPPFVTKTVKDDKEQYNNMSENFLRRYNQKKKDLNTMKLDTCKNLCFEGLGILNRVHEYMALEYNLFIETSIFDCFHRKLIKNNNLNDIIKYLDTKVIKRVLKESKEAIQHHLYYISDFNLDIKKLPEPISTRDSYN